ncbi:MAG TPA: (d)CMP kinase [Bacteroidota bacterium]|nr:(d)CMP kinase [Bacteroidota bacterium]
MKKLIIAIDGPAASGKSSTAKRVARELGYIHIDTGAMYRAVALKAIRQGIDAGDIEAIGRMAASTTVRIEYDRIQTPHVLLDGEDVTDSIRLPEVSKAASAISAVPAVRELLVREQRVMGVAGGIVMDGRDIGTVVFPEAELKIFMVADVYERAVRRAMELEEKGIRADILALEREIMERDKNDSTRVHSPLKKADDAIVINTTRLTIEEQTAMILSKVKELLA